MVKRVDHSNAQHPYGPRQRREARRLREDARAILAALDAPQEANMCAPSTEGLPDKEVEDHG
jgi:hypothetical protein